VSPTGLMVTNAHVIKSMGDAEIRVVLADRREFTARVIQQDRKSDIAILQIEGAPDSLPFLEFAESDDAQVGDLVLAIGNPFGVGQTVTSGIVSALSRSKVGRSNNQVFIQTDAAINPGNSGGALVDMDGRLLGINTAIFSRSGGSNGIGFAIPARLVQVYVDSAASGRKVARVWIGARLQNVGRDIAQSLGLERVSGAIVERVVRDGPAASAGLRVGDVITAVNGRDVADARAANFRLTTIGVGKSARLTVLRNDRVREIDLELQQVPKPRRGDVRVLSGDHPFDGVQVANLVPAIIEQLNVNAAEGVLVLGIRRDGFGASMGFLKRGDIIREVSGRPATSIAGLQRILRRRARVWDIQVQRGRRMLRFRVQA
ncbi:MAG: trypsin-like peptidase domain-containing protein, partial [Pseudomonadota bacterium]